VAEVREVRAAILVFVVTVAVFAGSWGAMDLYRRQLDDAANPLITFADAGMTGVINVDGGIRFISAGRMVCWADVVQADDAGLGGFVIGGPQKDQCRRWTRGQLQEVRE
jgi:hypothetical protein